jgi:hypothetical protein
MIDSIGTGLCQLLKDHLMLELTSDRLQQVKCLLMNFSNDLVSNQFYMKKPC